MKKLLISALSAAMVIALVASTAVVAGAEETKQPDYDKYVSEELAPKYGYADMQEKNRLIDELSAADLGLTNEDLSGWNKYNGILGYNVVDLNNDSKDDLLVYYFDDETNINTLKADFFTTNENGEIYNADTVVLDTQDGLSIDYCVGGMTEFNGKEYLYIETAIYGVRSNGYDAVNAFYTCDDNNKLIIDYRMYRNDMTTYGLEIRNEDGSYTTETCDDVYSAFDKMGFDVTYKSVANVLSDLGFNNYEGHSWLANIPSYYGHSSLKNLFYVVCAPIDPTDNTDEEELLDYKSVVGFDKPVEDDSTEVDIEKYVHDVIVPTYGYCSVEDMTKTFSVSEVSKLDPLVDGWSKRTGMLGYDVVDINGDSKDDLLVYYFADDTDINTLKVDLFTTDKNGEFGKTDSIILDSQKGLFMEYCVGGITELNGKNYLCVETGHSGVFSNGVYFENNFYTCDENNKLVIDYSIKQSGEGSSLYNYQLVTRNSDGEYDTEMIWDFDSEEDRKEALLGAYEKIGFSSTDYKLSDLFSSLGYKNYEEYFVSGIPTYFYGNGNMISEFKVICAPIDMSIPEGGVKTREFKSIVSFNTDCYEDIDKVESNVSSTESNTNSDVTSDESTASTNSTVSNTSSQNSSTSSKNTSTATSKTTSTNTVKSVDTVKTAGLISVIGLIAVLFVAGVVVVTVKKKADKE